MREPSRTVIEVSCSVQFGSVGMNFLANGPLLKRAMTLL